MKTKDREHGTREYRTPGVQILPSGLQGAPALRGVGRACACDGISWEHAKNKGAPEPNHRSQITIRQCPGSCLLTSALRELTTGETPSPVSPRLMKAPRRSTLSPKGAREGKSTPAAPSRGRGKKDQLSPRPLGGEGPGGEGVRGMYGSQDIKRDTTLAPDFCSSRNEGATGDVGENKGPAKLRTAMYCQHERSGIPAPRAECLTFGLRTSDIGLRALVETLDLGLRTARP